MRVSEIRVNQIRVNQGLGVEVLIGQELIFNFEKGLLKSPLTA